MNQREKILAGVVGLLILAVGANYGVKRVMGWFDARKQQVAEAKSQLHANRLVVEQGKLDKQALDAYMERSLPSKVFLASSKYRAWLHGWVEKVGIRNQDVEYTVARRWKDVYDTLTFSVTCEGDLKQLTELLFDFYSTDYMHRIKHMTARRLKNKQLSLSFTIEAVALLDAPAEKELVERPSERLAFSDVKDYFDVIVNRNPYSPANQPPWFASSNRAQGYVNETWSFRSDAEDPEKGQVSYRLGEHKIDGLTIDERSGEIEWTPKEKGEFEILVFAADNGMPSKETSQKITLEVTDPPPAVEPEPEPPSFDSAKFTFVTAIVEVNERPQVWLTDRTAGNIVRLFEGDSFEIGLFKGTIKRIYERRIEIDCGGSLVTVEYGHSLSDGTVSPQDSSS